MTPKSVKTRFALNVFQVLRERLRGHGVGIAIPLGQCVAMILEKAFVAILLDLKVYQLRTQIIGEYAYEHDHGRPKAFCLSVWLKVSPQIIKYARKE